MSLDGGSDEESTRAHIVGSGTPKVSPEKSSSQSSGQWSERGKKGVKMFNTVRGGDRSNGRGNPRDFPCEPPNGVVNCTGGRPGEGQKKNRKCQRQNPHQDKGS